MDLPWTLVLSKTNVIIGIVLSSLKQANAYSFSTILDLDSLFGYVIYPSAGAHWHWKDLWIIQKWPPSFGDLVNYAEVTSNGDFVNYAQVTPRQFCELCKNDPMKICGLWQRDHPTAILWIMQKWTPLTGSRAISSGAAGGFRKLCRRLWRISFLEKTLTTANSSREAKTKMRQTDIQTSIALM